MSETSAPWLAPLQTDTATHLAGLLDLEPAAPATAPAAAPVAPVTASATVTPGAAPAGTVAPAPARDGVAMVNDAVRGVRGLVAVPVPELPYPLWFRASSGDPAVCLAALAPGSGGARIPYLPRRILEIGAGAGYRTVALARSFPNTEILATEADPDAERVGKLNTLPYRNVTYMNVAVSETAERYAYTGRHAGAGHLRLVPRADGPIKSVPLSELLAKLGWDTYDTVVMSPDTASAFLLRANPWPAQLRMIIVDASREPLGPLATAAYPEEQFVIRTDGDYVMIYRREVDSNLPAPLPVPLFDPAGQPGTMVMTHVPDMPARYFPIFPYGFRLHPNLPTEPPAQITLSHHCLGQRQLSARLRVGHAEAGPVKFSITILSEPDGKEVFHVEKVVNGGSEQTIKPALPGFFGPCRLVFTTQMAEGGSNKFAWAEVLDAVWM
jgi:hypothetical protein